MKAYCTHNPKFMLLSFTEYGTKEDEADIHQFCVKYKYSTEWFKDDIKVYEIWENFVKVRNLIPKNCFYNFPKEMHEFSILYYKQSWDSTVVFKLNDLNEEIYTESNKITLMKYFGRKQKSFTQEDFVKACKLVGKELNTEINKNTLKKFGYDIAGNTEIVTVYKL